MPLTIGIGDLESRIVLDSLTWGDKVMLSPQISGETGVHS